MLGRRLHTFVQTPSHAPAPCRMYWPWQDMNEVVAELKKQGPWWDRKQGADHIFVVTADPGK